MSIIGILEYYRDDNQSLLLIKDETNSLNIQLNTRNTQFYCYQCDSFYSGDCTCKDKYWIKGIWNGYLFRDNISNYDVLITNIYTFLKDNFEYILNLNQPQFKTFLKNNENELLLIYYHDKMIYLLNYTQYLIDLGIFKREFYEYFKLMFTNKYKHINVFNVESVDCNENTISIDISIYEIILNIKYDDNSLIDSLSKISFNSISNTEYLFEKLNNEKFFILDKPLDFSSMFTYISNFLNYYCCYDLLKVILKDKLDDNFLKIYNEIQDIKTILYYILEIHG